MPPAGIGPATSAWLGPVRTSSRRRTTLAGRRLRSFRSSAMCARSARWLLQHAGRMGLWAKGRRRRRMRRGMGRTKRNRWKTRRPKLRHRSRGRRRRRSRRRSQRRIPRRRPRRSRRRGRAASRRRRRNGSPCQSTPSRPGPRRRLTPSPPGCANGLRGSSRSPLSRPAGRLVRMLSKPSCSPALPWPWRPRQSPCWPGAGAAPPPRTSSSPAHPEGPPRPASCRSESLHASCAHSRQQRVSADAASGPWRGAWRGCRMRLDPIPASNSRQIFAVRLVICHGERRRVPSSRVASEICEACS
mmetsp:Transcript_121348/g.348680  ORF Transcript_121348/g.348680 Transcript_121348/m.348680 type:complete len:301 (+) Transcript_121348:511-1413(+)